MPLDNRKAQHIQQLVQRSLAGRQRSVVLVSLSSGVYSYSAIQGIMRRVQALDPQIPGVSKHVQTVDAILLVPLNVSFVGAIYIADTTTATASAVAAAQKYELVEVLPVGILPGGSQQRVLLRRLR